MWPELLARIEKHWGFRSLRPLQEQAMRAWETEGDFQQSIEADQKILSYLTLERIREAFSVPRYLANVDQIFARAFKKV